MKPNHTQKIIIIIILLIYTMHIGSRDSIKVNYKKNIKKQADSTLITYPAPKGELASLDYKIEVNDEPIFVYTVKVVNGEMASFVYFDFSGTANIKITAKQYINNAVIRPLSSNIALIKNKDTISFSIVKPMNLTIELNNTIDHALHIFANPIEEKKPSPNDPNVIYFGPGIHELSSISIPDNSTVYIEGGAIVKGKIMPQEEPFKNRSWANQKVYKSLFLSNNAKNVRICGRGIIDASLLPWHSKHPIRLFGCSNFELEGVIIKDSPTWSFAIFNSEHGKISNVKVFTHRDNGDGIDVVNSQDITIDNCFLRTWDDAVCVKDINNGSNIETKNILIKNCIIWNERAHGLGITFETHSNITNVIFRKCEIIHDFSNRDLGASLGIIVCDSGKISDIRFEDISIEDTKRNLISCSISKSFWSKDKELGHIDNVLFRNIHYYGDNFPNIILRGCSQNNLIENVCFDTLYFNKKLINTIDDKFYINYARNIQFTKESLFNDKILKLMEIKAINDSCVYLKWNEVNDPDSEFKLYSIYRDGKKIYETCMNSYYDKDLKENTTYSYYISYNNKDIKTDEAKITTLFDDKPPELQQAWVDSNHPTMINLSFNKLLNKKTVEDIKNYNISSNILIKKAILNEDQKTIILEANLPIKDAFQTISCKNIVDLSIRGNKIIQKSYKIYLNANGLVGYWKLNEEKDKTVFDSSGNNIKGIFNGNPIWIKELNNYGLMFNPVDGYDYVEIANSDILDKVQEGDYTVCAWYKPLSIPSGKTSDNFPSHGIVIKPGYQIGLSYSFEKKFIMNHFLEETNKRASAVSIKAYDPNEFYYITGVVDYNNGITKIYVNGKLDNLIFFAPCSKVKDLGKNPWRIGIADPNNPRNPFPAHGIINEVQIFEIALTDEQILSLFKATKTETNR